MRDLLKRRRPSPALAVAFVALIAALTGSAVALPGSNGVNSGDIKNNSVRSKDVRNNNLTGKDIKNLAGGDVRNDSLSGSDINESSLGKVPSATAADAAGLANRANSAATVDTVKTAGSYKKAAPSASNTDPEVAQTQAAEVPFLTFGPLTVYGKCFTDSDDDTLYSRVYIKTSQDGSVLEASGNDLYGDPFLDIGTDEDDRELGSDSTSNDSADVLEGTLFSAAAPDGTGVTGQFETFFKAGEIPDSQGLYGAGSQCIYLGHLIG